MAKDYWDKFEFNTWIGDPELSLCAPATRGIWIDAICRMLQLDRCGQLTGLVPNLAKGCRCTSREMRAAIDELKMSNAADVVEDDSGTVTLANRRMRRAWTARKLNADKQKRHRDRKRNPSVTQQSKSNELELERKPRADSGEPKKKRKQPAGDHHELIRFFAERWEARYGTKYIFGDGEDAGKDGAHIKWILAKAGLENAKRAVVAYLADNQKYLTDARHPVGLFRSGLNKYNAITTSKPVAVESQEQIDRRKEIAERHASELAQWQEHVAEIQALPEHEREGLREYAVNQFKDAAVRVKMSQAKWDKRYGDGEMLLRKMRVELAHNKAVA